MDSLPVHRYSDSGCAHYAHAPGRLQRVAESKPLVLRCNRDLRPDNLSDERGRNLRSIPKQCDPGGTTECERHGDTECVSRAYSRLPVRYAELDRTGSTPHQP